VNKELNFTTAAEEKPATADAAFYFIPQPQQPAPRSPFFV